MLIIALFWGVLGVVLMLFRAYDSDNKALRYGGSWCFFMCALALIVNTLHKLGSL